MLPTDITGEGRDKPEGFVATAMFSLSRYSLTIYSLLAHYLVRGTSSISDFPMAENRALNIRFFGGRAWCMIVLTFSITCKRDR